MRNPLWMPRGSVRALIALGVIGTAMTMYLLNRDLPESFVAVVSTVILVYFNDRSKANGA